VTVSGRSRGFMLMGAVVLTVLTACSMSPTMELAAPAASGCPARGLPRATTGPPDTLSLRWYRASVERDVRLSSSWCGTVGDDVFLESPSPAFPTWSGEGALRVATWNYEVGAGRLLEFIGEELGLDCRGGGPLRADGVQPFVLLLQEAWRRSGDLPSVERNQLVPWTVDPERQQPVLDVVGVARACGLALLYVPSARNGPDDGPHADEDKGNAILSTLPLTAPIALELPFEAGRKVAVAANVRAPGGERVRLVSAHLDVASTLFRTLVSGNQTRARQAKGLIDGLEKAERDGPLTGVVVVGGDFNSLAGNESALKHMRAAFPQSPEWDGLPTWLPLSFPVDHIFFRRSGFTNFTIEGYRRIEEAYGSDHLGRRLEISYESARARD